MLLSVKVCLNEVLNKDVTSIMRPQFSVLKDRGDFTVADRLNNNAVISL